MRLKKLELQGFKSFANRTEIFFDKGVTCVVGPNGCGKSNISDSIRWVLGERSAKMLRGSKMEDVIFNGTDFRKPVNYAEVSLTFDNTDRGLPIDYNEVTIGRRLYRTGESEYLINKTLVRLKDIQDLILDTGIGSSSYSMIEQGRIDYILNANADERRFLIEEAAGISKYKVKKDEALRKLERTEQNLLRLKDIVQEVHRNIQYAERQAKRAERYKEHFERLKKLETGKAFYDLQKLAGEKTNLESQRTATNEEFGRLETEKVEMAQKLSRKQDGLRDLMDCYSLEESKRYDLRSRVEKNQQQLSFHQEKKLELAVRRGEIQQEEAHLAERIQKIEKDIASKNEETSNLIAQAQTISVELEESRNQLHTVEQEIGQIKGMLDQGKGSAFEIATEMTKIKNEYHRLLAFLESCEKQKNKMDGSLERFANERMLWEGKEQDCEKEIKAHIEKMTALESQAKNYDFRLTEVELALHQLGMDREKTERELHESRVRLELLRKLDVDSGVDKETVLKSLPGMDGALIKSVRDIIKVEPGFEWALEAVLGIFAQSWIAENIETAEKLFSYMLKSRSSGIGLMVRRQNSGSEDWTTYGAPEHPLIQCSLKDVVKVQEGYDDVFSLLFDDVFIVEDLPAEALGELFEISKYCLLVTRGGVCLGPGGYIYFRQNLNAEQSSFMRGQEMQSIENRISELTSAEAALIARQQDYEGQLQEVKAQVEAVRVQTVDCKIQKESFESIRHGLRDRLQSHHREQQLVFQDIEELKSQQRDAQARREILEKDLANMIEKERLYNENEQNLRSDLEMKEQVRSQAAQKNAEMSARFSYFEEQERLIREAIAMFEDNNRQDRERLRSLAEETVRISDKEKEIDHNDEIIKEQQIQLDSDLRKADLALEVMKQEKTAFENEVTAFQQLIREMTEKQQALQSALHQSEMSVMDVGYREKAVHERLEQTYHIRLADLNPDDFPWGDSNLEEVEAELAKLREKVESIGTVNLLAIEEYEELKQRFDFLDNQQKDLEQSREELLEAIRKINRTTKALFDETFVNVQKNFQEYYQILFRGGEARLILVDELHPLESGIDIVVRPPGKKLQQMTLLSGGEKALTAIALLFALFKIRPSPFCVLDEVDAPLDEANIDRFLTVLRTFLEYSQFIIVTHNRKTIAMGDSLYGVTMQEAGVSKIVSVKVRSSDEGPLSAVEGAKDSSASQITENAEELQDAETAAGEKGAENVKDDKEDKVEEDSVIA